MVGAERLFEQSEFPISLLYRDLHPYFQRLDAHYLIIRSGKENELQVKVGEVAVDSPGGVICFLSKDGSVNGSVGYMIDGREATSLVSTGRFVDRRFSQDSTIKMIGLRLEPNAVCVDLGSSDEHFYLALEQATVIIGTLVDSQKKDGGVVFLKGGKLNSELLSPETREVFKDYLAG